MHYPRLSIGINLIALVLVCAVGLTYFLPGGIQFGRIAWLLIYAAGSGRILLGHIEEGRAGGVHSVGVALRGLSNFLDCTSPFLYRLLSSGWFFSASSNSLFSFGSTTVLLAGCNGLLFVRRGQISILNAESSRALLL